MINLIGICNDRYRSSSSARARTMRRCWPAALADGASPPARRHHLHTSTTNIPALAANAPRPSRSGSGVLPELSSAIAHADPAVASLSAGESLLIHGLITRDAAESEVLRAWHEANGAALFRRLWDHVLLTAVGHRHCPQPIQSINDLSPRYHPGRASYRHTFTMTVITNCRGKRRCAIPTAPVIGDKPGAMNANALHVSHVNICRRPED